MASRLLTRCAPQYIKIQSRSCHHVPDFWDGMRADIGTREIVGHGWNGEPAYLDRHDYPMPAIRWKNNTPDVMALREKEKGDWKKLTIDEKKALYRASFRQTFAEMDAPTGEWKRHISVTLLASSLGLLLFIYVRWNVQNKLPESFTRENQLIQYERMIKMEVNPISGITARYRKKMEEKEAKRKQKANQ